MYISPRMLGGSVKVSLHQSGSWQLGLTTESPAHFRSAGSRHWDIWKRGGKLAPGTVRAWYLLIPDETLRVGYFDNKAYKLPPVGPEHAASIELLMLANEGPTVEMDDAHLVGRWRLEGSNESCLTLARRIPWTAGLREWADAARSQAVAQAKAAAIPESKDHRYYFHGHDAQGVRFGLELA